MALNPPLFGGKIIELGKFCFIKKKIQRNFSFSFNLWALLTLCEISILNFEISPGKYAMKKQLFYHQKMAEFMAWSRSVRKAN